MSKKFIAVLFGIMLCLCLVFSACDKNPDGGDKTGGESDGTEQVGGNGEITEMYIYANGNKLEVALERNSSVEALVEILKKDDIVYTATANAFEIYGNIGQSLPTEDRQITSQAGDVLLWARSNICIFFGNNSYSYTRIGRIEGYTASELKEILAPSGSVQVRLSIK